MRAEVRPRRAALPPHPRPQPPSTTGAAATEPRGAQGSGGSPGTEPSAGPGPVHRQPGGKSRGAAEPVPLNARRAPPNVPPNGLAGCVTQASSLSRRPGGRTSAALMWLQPPRPPAPVLRAASLFSPGGAARPAPAPDQLQGAGRPVPRRGRGKRRAVWRRSGGV